MCTLVVMAAGIGRRFGGDKQLAAVGPGGETFLDYSITDAAASGASKVVLIVRSEIESAVRSHIDERHSELADRGVEFDFVCQDVYGPRRVKPWGTAHAVLSASSAVSGPFMVCNADDYYGSSSFAALASGLGTLDDGEAALCGYRLGLTLPAAGTVSRGVCEVSGDRLVSIVEHHGVGRGADGKITSTGPAAALSDDTIVSMNLWAFAETAFGWIGESFERFLSEHGDDPDTECLLPTAVAGQMARGRLSVRLVITEEAWIGVTNPEDLLTARAALSQRRALAS